MNKLERLHLAAQVAPGLRDKTPRRIKTVDDAGKVIRVIDDVTLAEAMLARVNIELSLREEVARLHCRGCGLRLKSKGKTGRCAKCRRQHNEHRIEASDSRVRAECAECGRDFRRARRSVCCADCIAKRSFTCQCGRPLTKMAFTPSHIRRRGGAPPVCRSCAGKLKIGPAVKARLSALTAEEKRERAARLVATRKDVSPARRAEIGRAVAAKRTAAERSELVKKAWQTRKRRVALAFNAS